MSKDLEIIKELKKKIGIKFDRLDIEDILYFNNRYSIDENENIVELSLSGLEISNISFLKDLKNLTHLNLRNNQISDISFLKD